MPLFSPNQLQLLPSFRKDKKISRITCPEQRHLTPGLAFSSSFLSSFPPQADNGRGSWGGRTFILYPLSAEKQLGKYRELQRRAATAAWREMDR